ncbi:hypothetical protein [Spartinivicinus poritis]|uniref:Uncharacterized protein n=1 Tax=Spartinivicinus poritis TaxID=2994640 RepID=A0ABT5UJ37_9GAMM|nr:hypothetical protein [Spartinivicinus sp. A2-2]MDE1465537.1 hypothetical protein [Spartinivicinus sp. A2-2]
MTISSVESSKWSSIPTVEMLTNAASVFLKKQGASYQYCRHFYAAIAP